MVMEVLAYEANMRVAGEQTGNVYPSCPNINPSVPVSRILT